jgi:hypothetical protein
VVSRVFGCLAEALDDMGWGGDVGVADAEADHIYSLRLFPGYLPADFNKEVRRQFLDAFG